MLQHNSTKKKGGDKDKSKNEVITSKDYGRRKYALCSHYKKDNHPKKYYCYRPNVQYRVCKQYGYMEKVCQNKGTQVLQAYHVQSTDEVHQNEEMLL